VAAKLSAATLQVELRQSRFQIVDQVSAFPWEEVALGFATEMAISRGLAINRLVQAQMRANSARCKTAQFCDAHDGRFNLIIANRAGAMRVDIQRQRLGHANGISKLNGAACGQASGNDILRQIARDISGRTVNLCRILAGKRTAAMRGCAAISVDNDFAASQASIAIRPADFEAARWVYMIFGVGEQACRQQVSNNFIIL
jgi:hypothetical protein